MSDYENGDSPAGDRRIKTIYQGGRHYLACQHCGGSLPARKKDVRFFDYLMFCSDQCVDGYAQEEGHGNHR